MRASEIAAVLESSLRAGDRTPFWLWGPPGVGKSSVCRQVAESLGLEFQDLRGTTLDPVDLRGVPKVEGGVTKFFPPDFLPRSGRGVLMLDELAQCSADVQKPFFQLCLERRLGEYAMPDGWFILAASNRVEDRAGARTPLSALLNRFTHLDMDVSVEDWQAWAVAAGVPAEVRAFINWKPGHLFDFKPELNERAFASPRSWAFAGERFKSTPPQYLHAVLAGTVGEGKAAEFAAFLALYKQLPDLDQLLANPSGAPVPKEPSVVISLVGALTEKCRQDKSRVPAAVKYGMRLPDEYGVLALRDLVALDRGVVADKAVQLWVSSMRSKGLFLGA